MNTKFTKDDLIHLSGLFEKQSFDVRSISGNVTIPGFTAPKINWVKNNEAENSYRIRNKFFSD